MISKNTQKLAKAAATLQSLWGGMDEDTRVMLCAEMGVDYASVKKTLGSGLNRIKSAMSGAQMVLAAVRGEDPVDERPSKASSEDPEPIVTLYDLKDYL